jgi:hypothetical protein
MSKQSSQVRSWSSPTLTARISHEFAMVWSLARLRPRAKRAGEKARVRVRIHGRLARTESQQATVQHTVDHEEELGELPFHRQGALSLYDQEVLRQRVAIRHHPDIEHVLDVWWQST